MKDEPVPYQPVCDDCNCDACARVRHEAAMTEERIRRMKAGEVLPPRHLPVEIEGDDRG